MVQKAVACLLRGGSNEVELLVFTHPNGTMQIPKGTVDPGELPRNAVLRELQEESGVEDAEINSAVCRLQRVRPRGPQGMGPLEDQLWHVFSLHSGSPMPDSWSHTATGSAEEEGLVFSLEWIPLSEADRLLDPLFQPVVEALLSST